MLSFSSTFVYFTTQIQPNHPTSTPSSTLLMLLLFKTFILTLYCLLLHARRANISVDSTEDDTNQILHESKATQFSHIPTGGHSIFHIHANVERHQPKATPHWKHGHINLLEKKKAISERRSSTATHPPLSASAASRNVINISQSV